MSGPRIGSFCSGVGGLDLAVEELTDGRVVWHAENDPHASAVLAARWPGVPNHGDLKTFDWATAEQIDVLCGGFPCTPFSTAGKRKAMADERWLWGDITRALRGMGTLPGWIFLENVRGLLTAGGGLAMGHVLHDLAHLGYMGRYGLLPASAVGAPHQRERVFIVAHLADTPSSAGGRPELQAVGAPAQPAAEPRERRGPHVADAASVGWHGRPGSLGAGWGFESEGCRFGASADAKGHAGWVVNRDSQTPTDKPGRGRRDFAADTRGPDNGDAAPFGVYQGAVDRWAGIIGRPVPWPPVIGRSLNARLVEWMMGWPDGWVTDLVPNRHALRLCGNGVVPQQALAAYRILLADGVS